MLHCAYSKSCTHLKPKSVVIFADACMPGPALPGWEKHQACPNISSSAQKLTTLSVAVKPRKMSHATEVAPNSAIQKAFVFRTLLLWSTGPRKPSEDTNQSVLQPSSSSLSLPKGLLQRHALSLGSSLGSSPARGFSRRSPAGGVLDHLQIPNRLGLKFPSRDFARASKTLTSAPLSPKASLPKPKAPSPRPVSPVVEPVRAASPAAATEAEALPEAAPEAAAPEVSPEPEFNTLPEPKRPVRSRFTEEYLTPVVHSTRAEPARALPNEQPDRALPAAQQPLPSTVDTQTSTVAEQSDADPSLYGFKRHMSLREPLMGIERIYAHPRLGRPTADDVIATARPHMAEPQRRATTDFMLEAAEEADPAPATAAADDGDDEVYESDFVEDLVKTLSTGAADDDLDRSEAVAMLDLDAEMAGLLGPEEEDLAGHVMLDLDDEMEGLSSLAEVQGSDPQHGSDPQPSEDIHHSEVSHPTQATADVHDVLQRVTTDVEEQVTNDAAAAVDEAVASLGQEADSHFCQDQSVAVDSKVQSLTTAVATADAARQAEAVDTFVTNLTARVTREHDEQTAGEVETVVTSLTHQAEAAEEADQAAAITTVIASLHAQSAEHFEKSDSLVVSQALAGVQSEAVDHSQAQSLALVDEALGCLVGDTLGAINAEQAAAVGETLDTSFLCPNPSPSFGSPAPIPSRPCFYSRFLPPPPPHWPSCSAPFPFPPPPCLSQLMLV